MPPSANHVTCSITTTCRSIPSSLLGSWTGRPKAGARQLMTLLTREPETIDRNSKPILDTLSIYLKEARNVLEIASGYGRHIAMWAPAHPNTTFTPSDRDERLLARIRKETAGLANVREPAMLDVLKDEDWRTLEGPFDCLVADNLIHIAPWKVTEALFQHVPSLLPRPGAILAFYGPYLQDGQPATDGDRRFDEVIRQRDPSFGLRDVGAVEELAQAAGFELIKKHEMPAGNWFMIWRRRAS
jgi:SAM-dependent methyltransferase